MILPDHRQRVPSPTNSPPGPFSVRMEETASEREGRASAFILERMVSAERGEGGREGGRVCEGIGGD